MKFRDSLTAVGVGAGLTYFLDPNRGPRRRARIRDKVTHTAHVTGRALSTLSRDAIHRTYGSATALRHRMREEPVEDDVLVERVRAKLGRLVSHPHAIRVTASNGSVTIAGPILEREAHRLLRRVRRVRGVKEIIDALEQYERAGSVPALQGGQAPAGDRLDLFQKHWAPTTRLAAGAAGATLTAIGARRRDLPGFIAAVIGVGLVGRAVTNLPLSRLTGIGSGPHAIDVQKTITINAPLGEVYAFWSLYENFPLFMSRVLKVTTNKDPYQSHWTVSGPAGRAVEFDAEVTDAVPNDMIAWRTVKGSPIAHAGVVRFEPEAMNRTRVHLRMSYAPPAGWLGHELAVAFGVDPKASMDADLVRMKTLIETGRAPHDAALRQLSSVRRSHADQDS